MLISFLYGVFLCCRGLRRLDISSLPGISHPGMVIILLEEMLPQCEITANGYDLSLRQEEREGENVEQIKIKSWHSWDPNGPDTFDAYTLWLVKHVF